MLKAIPQRIDNVSAAVARKTKPFVETYWGRIFLSLALLGPITFLPLVLQAWTATNIDAFRTWAWPFTLITASSSLLGLIHNGDWRMRLVTTVWVVVFTSIWLATLVR